MKKFIINLCPTGIIPTKQMNPHVPLTPDEIALDTLKAYQLGTQMVHIHARDTDGKNTNSKEVYGDIISKIRLLCPQIIICVSLSGRIHNTLEARSSVLDLEVSLKPDMASLTLSSMNFSRNESINSPEMIVQLLQKMNEKGIKPELEVFDVGMINYSKYLIQKGLLKGPFYYNILLGNLFSAQHNPAELSAILHALPENSYYCIAGLGDYQLKSNISGLMFADGVRVGLEDNIYFDSQRKQVATNELLVKRIIELGKIMELEPYTCEEVRKLLEIN